MKLKKLEKCDISSKPKGERSMKKLWKKIKENLFMMNFFVMAFMVYAANTRCAWIGHQPKMPDEIRKFKRG